MFVSRFILTSLTILVDGKRGLFLGDNEQMWDHETTEILVVDFVYKFFSWIPGWLNSRKSRSFNQPGNRQSTKRTM
jgi:hypothetical protein